MFKYLFVFITIAIYQTPIAHFAKNEPILEIPFMLVDSRAFIEVTFEENSSKYHFILDSGGVNVVDLNLAKELNANLFNHQRFQGVGESQFDSYEIKIDEISIGPVILKNKRFYATDLSKIKENLNLPYLDGIIGYNFFKDKIIEFDYPNQILRVYYHYFIDDFVPFVLYHSQVPRVKLRVNGKLGNFIVDTGDRFALTIHRHFYENDRQHQLSDTTITGYGLGGPILAQLSKTSELSLGSKTFYNIPTRVIAMKSGRFTHKDIDGSIGGGILINYKVVIDYKNNRLYIN